MAIIKCPQCGKEVSDRTQKCPRCNTVLIEVQEKEKISVETVKTTAKENIINVALSTVFVFVAFIVCSFIAKLLASTFMGNYALEAIQLVDKITFSNKVLILILSTVFFCVLPLLFRQKPDIGYVSGIIITIILCIVCFCKHNSEVGNGLLELGRPDLYGIGTIYGKFNGFIIPLLHGALSFMGYEKETKQFVIRAIKALVVFFIIFGAGSFLLVAVVCMGTTGIALAQTLGSILIFVWAVVKSNEMKKLIKKA